MTLLSVAILRREDSAAVLAAFPNLPQTLRSALQVLDGPTVSLLALRSEPTDAPPDPRAWIHLIASLHERFDILPMRLGDRAESESAALELLHRRDAQLRLNIDQLTGKTEFSARLHVEAKPAPVDVPSHPSRAEFTSGALYLRRQARQYAGLDGIPVGLTDRVRHWLTTLDMPNLSARLEGPSPLIHHPALFFLVPRRSAPLFVERFHERRGELGIPMTLTGPWAPFNFVRAVDAVG